MPYSGYRGRKGVKEKAEPPVQTGEPLMIQFKEPKFPVYQHQMVLKFGTEKRPDNGPHPSMHNLYCDASVRFAIGNTRGSSAYVGGFISSDRHIQYQFKDRVDDVPLESNFAELKAIEVGLESALKMGIKRISVRTDSQCAFKIMKRLMEFGEVDITENKTINKMLFRNKNSKAIFVRMMFLINKFDHIHMKLINRKFNKIADILSRFAHHKDSVSAKVALDAQVIQNNLTYDFINEGN